MPDSKVVRKILRYLHERFYPKVTSIEERKNINTMKTKELIDSLQTLKFKLQPIKNSIALKVDKLSNEEEFDEEFILIAKKFKKFFRESMKDFKKSSFPNKKMGEN